MKKVFPIFFIVLITMFCSCGSDEPTKPLQLNSSDRQLLEQLSHDVITKLKIGIPSETMDSMLLSYGFTYEGDEYAYNLPSEDFDIYVQKGMDLPIKQQQFAEHLSKGNAIMHASFMYNDKKQVSHFLLRVGYSDSITDVRPILLMFSDSLYQKVKTLAPQDDSRGWEAGIRYTLPKTVPYDYEIYFADNDDEQHQRPAFIDRITNEAHFRSFEHHVICNTPAIQQYDFSINFALSDTMVMYNFPCSGFMVEYY